MSKLLVIDDCEIHHFIMDKMLENAGIFDDREKSFDARSVIDQLETDRLDEDKLPDVIFLDLMMPGFNGFDFLERFKKLQQYLAKTIHIFVFTCSINPTDKTKADRYTFIKGFVVKPMSMQTLNSIALAYDNQMQLS